MKILRYQVETSVNYGTEEKPNIVTSLEPGVIGPMCDALVPSNLAAVQTEAYNGEVTVEDVPDVPMPPTVEELATENKLLRQQVVALTDRGDFQEELIVELANIVYA